MILFFVKETTAWPIKKNDKFVCLNIQVCPDSFASGGDSDSLDYIAYVAKDNSGRPAHTHKKYYPEKIGK